ncbi:MAG TPA: crosslink repair DNA glycosylase YcaQ family protein, partial [Ktedonobacterales bacterium]|nr:crosslink repair DNA glycosylase YcaQ family protein [Ktedonobacterales bacterium]
MSTPLSLTWEQVCAWRLSQQHLIERASPERLLEVANDLIGIQAQVLSSAELALWARVQDMPPDALSNALWKQRVLIKTWAMRGALHLFTAA